VEQGVPTHSSTDYYYTDTCKTHYTIFVNNNRLPDDEASVSKRVEDIKLKIKILI
jgi:hypothetical protein